MKSRRMGLTYFILYLLGATEQEQKRTEGRAREKKKGNICIKTVTIILTQGTQSKVLIGHMLRWNVLDENGSP